MLCCCTFSVYEIGLQNPLDVLVLVLLAQAEEKPFDLEADCAAMKEVQNRSECNSSSYECNML